MRFAPVPLLLLCTACAGTPGGVSPLGGAATYDALKQATDACTEQGGTLKLDPNSPAERLTSYSCKPK